MEGDPSTEETLPRAEGATDEEVEGELRPGQILGEHYRVEKRIGRGAMGAVYVVEHLGLGKRFAAKVVSAARASDANAVRRLRSEARTLSAIEHENIVTVTHLGQTGDGRLFVVMELLEGEDLGSRMQRQRLRAARGQGMPWLPDEEVAEYVPQLLSALTAAHQAQVVHRDLKPDNLFLAKKRGRDLLKVVDFGISKMRQVDDAPSLTQTGQILGTPLYMAPEQGKSTAEVDARADLYSFGCILHEMLTGQPPFVADGVYDCIVKHATEAPNAPSLLRPDLSPELDAIVLRCLQKKPGNRYANAEEILEAFELAWSHGPTTGEVFGERPKLQHASASSMDAASEPSLEEELGDGARAARAESIPEDGPPVASAGLDTTASMERAHPSAARRWQLGLGVLLLLGLAGGAYAMYAPAAQTTPAAASATPTTATPTTATPTTATPTTATPTTATPTTATAVPAVDPNAVEPDTSDAKPDDQAQPVEDEVVAAVPVQVHVRTSPSGATVYSMGESLGRTPIDITLPESGELNVEVARAGYRMEHVHLSAEEPEPATLRLRGNRRAPALAPR